MFQPEGLILNKRHLFCINTFAISLIISKANIDNETLWFCVNQ